jgi:hypothetical protein
MPRNPRPDQIGISGRMLSESVAGSSRNTHFELAKGEPDQIETVLDLYDGGKSLKPSEGRG